MEQLSARLNAEHALVEAQTRIAQLEQALQQGGRSGTAGQMVDARVLGRPDMGWRRESTPQLELRDGSSRGSHRSGAVNGQDECRMQYGCAEQRSYDRSEEGQEYAVVLRPDHAMHGKGSGSHRKCTARVGHGGAATSYKSERGFETSHGFATEGYDNAQQLRIGVGSLPFWEEGLFFSSFFQFSFFETFFIFSFLFSFFFFFLNVFSIPPPPSPPLPSLGGSPGPSPKTSLSPSKILILRHDSG